MTDLNDLRIRLEAVTLERDHLRQRIAVLEDALQSCLSRSRH